MQPENQMTWRDRVWQEWPKRCGQNVKRFMSLLRTARALRLGSTILLVLARSLALLLPHTLIHMKQNENESWLVIAEGDILFIAV